MSNLSSRSIAVPCVSQSSPRVENGEVADKGESMMERMQVRAAALVSATQVAVAGCTVFRNKILHAGEGVHIKRGAILVLMALALIPAHAAHAAPPGTPARPALCQSTVTARFPGITVHYSCFAGESRFFFPGLSHVGFFLSPAEETVSLNRAAKSFGGGNGEMYIFFSSAPGCHYGAGVTLKLNDPCLLILSQAGFADSLPFAFLHSHGYSTVQGYVSRCGFKGGQPVFSMVQCAPGHPPANRTAGSITFTRFAFPPRLPPGADRWAPQHIGHFAFRFSAGAQVTGFYVNQSLATVTVAVPLAGAASGIID